VQEQGVWERLQQTLDAAVENAKNATAAAMEGTPIHGLVDVGKED
jgi:hypothetical protein